jgi:hypothetical protein
MKVKIFYTQDGHFFSVRADFPRRAGPGGLRGPITSFSKASRRRLTACLALLRRGAPTMFLTLTFHTDPGAAGYRRARNRFLQYLRDNYPRAGYLWRAEMQRRGVVHLHVLIVGLPYTRALADRLAWAWLRASDQANDFQAVAFHLGRLRSSKHCVLPFRDTARGRMYLTKYLGKDEERGVPASFNGYRRWGASYNLKDYFAPLTMLEGTCDYWEFAAHLVKIAYLKTGSAAVARVLLGGGALITEPLNFLSDIADGVVLRLNFSTDKVQRVGYSIAGYSFVEKTWRK